MFGGGFDRDAEARSKREAESQDRSDVVVMISTVIVPAAAEDAFLGWWRLARPWIALQPGFVSAQLHRSLDAREGYKYVNIVHWRGAEPYRSALAKLWTSGPPPIPGLDWRPQLYEIVEGG